MSNSRSGKYVKARSSFRGVTLGTPFLLRIFCLFCCYVTVFKDHFLLRYFFKYDSNSVSKFIIIFILSADKQRRKNAKVTNSWCYLLRF